MYVVRLRLLEQLPVSRFPVDHPTVHRDRLVQHFVQEIVRSGAPHGVDASLGQGEVDGLGEVQWCRGRIS